LLQCLLVEPRKIEIREVDVPAPSEGELLIKIGAALTCGTDLKAYIRGHPVIPMPGPFGHEFSGTVEAVGRGVEGFEEGEEVMAVHSAPCLSCAYCRKGLHNLCEDIMRTKALGAFAEYLLLPSRIVRQNAFHKPPGLPFEEAALLEPLSCVVHGLAPLDIREGDSVLIIGAGPIGLIHLMLIKGTARGVSAAVADVNRQRLDKALALGADATIDPSKKEVTDALDELTPSGMGFDYVFECTGRPEVWEASVGYLRRGGTLVLFGGCPKGTSVTYDTARLHYDEITMKGVFHYTPADVRKAHELILGGTLDLSGLISGSYPLKHIGKAFESLAEGEGIKYAIIP
jgi:L-iditol 2-dehydrogenase